MMSMLSFRSRLASGLWTARHHNACRPKPSRTAQLRCFSAVTASAAPIGLGDVLQLTCTGLNASGEGVCRSPCGCVVFVDRALPGEVVQARVTLKKKSFARAVKVQTLSAHDDVVAPPCPHFGPCGGCSLQSLDYQAQLRHKRQHVVELLARVGKVEGAQELVRPVLPSLQQYGHRNKLEFNFSMQCWVPGGASRSAAAAAAAPLAAADRGSARSGPQRQSGRVPRGKPGRDLGGRRGSEPLSNGSSSSGGGDVVQQFALGFFKPGSNRVVLPISECHLQPALANQLLQEVGQLCQQAGLSIWDPAARTGLLQSLVIRTASGTSGSRAGVASGNGKSSASSSSVGSSRGEGGGAGVEVMLNFVTARDGRQELGRLAPMIMKKFPAVVSVMNTVADTSRPAGERAIAAEHLLAGRPHLVERLCGLEFEVSANSFFQTSSAQAERLYQLVAEVAELRPSDNLLDLYCGTGTIGLSLAGRCRAVVGVEVVAPAVRDARQNAARNGITNARIVLADLDSLTAAGGLLGPAGAAAGGGGPRPDVVIVDPARQGLSPQVVSYLRRSGARRLVYVSCNPATQARDLALLRALPASGGAGAGSGSGSGSGSGGGSGGERAYRLVSVQPVDLFPQTMHCESVAVLDREG